MALTLIFRGNIAAIYIGSCLLGLSLSSMSPTVMSMAEQYIDINRKYAILDLLLVLTQFTTEVLVIL